MNTFKLTTPWGGDHNCCLYKNQYLETGGLYIGMLCEDPDYGWEPYADVTVNIGPLEDGLVAIKDYGENEGIMNSLHEIGLVTEIVDYRGCGLTLVPVCKIDLAVLEKYNIRTKGGNENG